MLIQRVRDYFEDRPMAKLPRSIAKQQEEEQANAEEQADEAGL